MKRDTHPPYDHVVFRDRGASETGEPALFLTRSTLAARAAAGGETVELDGRTYPVVDVDTSSASHPFWTGRGRVLDTEGRVQAFERRYGKRR